MTISGIIYFSTVLVRYLSLTIHWIRRTHNLYPASAPTYKQIIMRTKWDQKSSTATIEGSNFVWWLVKMFKTHASHHELERYKRVVRIDKLFGHAAFPMLHCNRCSKRSLFNRKVSSDHLKHIVTKISTKNSQWLINLPCRRWILLKYFLSFLRSADRRSIPDRLTFITSGAP